MDRRCSLVLQAGLAFALALASCADDGARKKRVNEPCANNTDCADRICHAGVCAASAGTALADGAPCHGNGECRSFVCTGGVCVAGTSPTGAECLFDEECDSRSCVAGRCADPSRRDSGVDASAADAQADRGTLDAGPDSGDRGDAGQGDSHQTSGEIVITEFMAAPSAVADAKGEFIELHNATSSLIDINGWVLADDAGESHIIDYGGPFMVAPGAFVVLGINKDQGTNGGVSVDYEYRDFALGDVDDAMKLLNSSGGLVDSVVYSNVTGFVIPKGASLSRKDVSADGSSSSSWCPETFPWAGSAGDRGSPGMAAGCS